MIIWELSAIQFRAGKCFGKAEKSIMLVNLGEENATK